MTKFEIERLTEMVVYILNVTKGLDYYKIFKILYFAEREHLSRYGMSMVDDKFVAMQYGPVPTELYDAFKNKCNFVDCFGDFYASVRAIDGGSAEHVYEALRNADLDYLSKSEIECLDKSIKENMHLSFDELVNKSHDSAWEKAVNGGGTFKFISSRDMAVAGDATSDVLDYFDELSEVELALS